MDALSILLLVIGCWGAALAGALSMRRVMARRFDRRAQAGSRLVEMHHAGPCAICRALEQIEIASREDR